MEANTGMEANPVMLLLQSLQGTPLAPIVGYGPLIIAICAILAAVLPQPSDTASPALKLLRRALDICALNIGAARNSTAPAASPKTTSTVAIFCLVFASFLLTACMNTQQQAQLTTDLQNANAVAVQDARLFCAVATPAGPIVVAVADAAGAPVVATGTAKLVVDASCAAINGIPVTPPAVGTTVPVVATNLPATAAKPVAQ